MQTDWYRTLKRGTYVVVPAGTRLATIALPPDVCSLFDVDRAVALIREVDSNATAWRLNFLGVDDCLRRVGFCIVRS